MLSFHSFMLGRGATAPQSFEEFLRREIKLNSSYPHFGSVSQKWGY